MSEQEIFEAALERDANLRTEYLDEVCGADAALRERIENLLRYHEEAGEYFEKPAAQIVATEPMPVIAEKPGTQIGPYKLLQQIGEGGMGTVFMAEQFSPVKRRVALKVIKPGMDTQQVIARFEAERQALAMMDHPNIAKVMDAGATGTGRPYFVMELVKGLPITQYCDEQHLSPRERLELFVPICQAVQHAHQKGIVHRDLKPSNILIARYDDKPVPKVIDFGIAKATSQKLTEKTMFTQYGQLVGTIEYMSPEQAQFNQLDVDTRSDIYSLGVLLYELLTGETPFDRTRLRSAAFEELLRIIREEEPPRPSVKLSTCQTLASVAANRHMEPHKLGKFVRGELDWIVMKALEKDRSRRYETAIGFAMDVERYLNDEPVQACPPTVSYRLRKFVQRNSASVLTGALVLLALIGGIVGTTWQMVLATHARAVAVREAAEKIAALERAQQSERDAKGQLFLALLNGARAGRFSRQMGQRLKTLAAVADAAQIRPDDRLRDEAIAAMALPDIRRVPVMCSAPPGTQAVGFDSQYRLYARADTSGVITIRRTADDREIQRIRSEPILGDSLFFSPDDQFLLGIVDGRLLRLWRVSDGQRVIQKDYRECWRNAFSPDGRRLAVGQKEQVICFDLATGHEVNRWALPAPVSSLAFHPDSRQLVVGQRRGSVVSVYDSLTGTLIADLPVGSMQDQFVAWHPDGLRLAVTSLHPIIQIWNVAARRKTATMEGHSHLVHTLTFHPDGSLLASYSWDGTLRLWDPATGRPLLKLPIAIMGRPQFSRDGRWLAAALTKSRGDLLEVTSSREYRTLATSGGIGAGAHTPADISPDGRLLAVGKADGGGAGVRLLDLQSGCELADLSSSTNFAFFDASPPPLPSSEGGGQAEDESDPAAPMNERWSLLTAGSEGLLRWAVTQKGERLQLGQPQQLSKKRRAWFTRSSTGHTLGVVTEEGGANTILDLGTGTVKRDLGIHPGGEIRALSADGQWAASSGWRSQSVRLWNAKTGQLVHEWVLATKAFVFFTPDSRSLIISQPDEFGIWDVMNLQLLLRLPREVAQFPGHVAFSPDGKLMCLEIAPGTIRLVEVSTGREVAELEDPHGDRATWIGFTPDGAKIVAVSGYVGAIHIWDLRAIRVRLKAMNLDWDWPEFPSEASQKLPIQTDSATAHDQLASALNERAWKLVVAADAAERDPARAVDLAKEATLLAPQVADYWNTLGAAHYRTGNWGDAILALRRCRELRTADAEYSNPFFLAMAHWQLGEKEEARRWYDKGVEWMEKRAAKSESLRCIRGEAGQLLGLMEPKEQSSSKTN